jgi:signal transduction histidine kinase/CheY-like chemotaxis protein
MAMSHQEKGNRKFHDPILPGKRGDNFLAIEQKYVQAAYKLDRELSRFEELYNYSTKLNNIKDDAVFLETFTESIVDLFDLECSALWLCDGKQLKDKVPQVLVTDGEIGFCWQDIADWCSASGIFRSGRQGVDIALLKESDPAGIKGLRQLIVGRMLDKNARVFALVLGFVTDIKSSFYDIDVVECQNSYKVYAGMVSMLIQNREVHEQILFQIEELKKARDAADLANRAKSQFLSNMSHELRTPLNAIIGFSDILRYSEELSDEDKDSVQEITQAGNHLLHLINDILDLARIEVGKIDFSPERVELDNVIAECVSLIAPLARKQGLVLNIQQHTGCHLVIDKTRLKQCLLNLLSNAIKYNNPRGQIRLYVDVLEDKRLRINISDTGAGISPESQILLFKPFERLNADKTGVEGTGIGLSLTQRIVEAMGGMIGVDSEVGKGSTFWLEFSYESITAVADKSAAQPDDTVAALRYRVIYIEDNPPNIKLMQRIISNRRDIDLVCAQSPSLGIELIREDTPDLLLLDINLPGITGYDIIAQLKRDPRTRKIPVFALTADAMPLQVQKGIDAGFNEYLTKPLNIGLFYDTLKKYLPDQSV